MSIRLSAGEGLKRFAKNLKDLPTATCGQKSRARQLSYGLIVFGKTETLCFSRNAKKQLILTVFFFSLVLADKSLKSSKLLSLQNSSDFDEPFVCFCTLSILIEAH